jgi:hypothetical protein
MPRRAVFAMLVALGCTPSEPGSPSVQEAPTPAPVEPVVAPTTPTPTTPAPITATAEPAPTPYVATPGLRAVAMREGSITLSGGAVLIDGEALVVRGGRVERDIARSRGLEAMLPDEYPGHTLAFAGALAPGSVAAMTTRVEFGRGATQHTVYVHEGERWRRLALERGAIIEYYPSLFVRGGGLFGMRAYALNPDAPGADDEENYALEQLFDKAIAKAKPGFVQLAGAKTAVPSLPKQVFIAAAASSADGTLYAITQPKPQRASDDADWPDPAWRPTLLMWAPDASEPETLALPDYVFPDDLRAEQVPSFTLTSSGDYALIGSLHDDAKPYLAVARGRSIESVAGGLDVGRSTLHGVRSAARAPSGELWLVLGTDDVSEPEHALWRRDSGTQQWSRVFLPKLDDPRATTQQTAWYYDHDPARFTEVVYTATTDEPIARAVVWLDGAAWIVAELGSVLEAENLLMSEVRRHALYTTHAGTAPLLVLPTQDRMTFEQLALANQGSEAKLGVGDCREISFVVAVTVPNAPDLATLERGALGLTSAQLDALAALPPIAEPGEPKLDADGDPITVADARVRAIQVGELPQLGGPAEPPREMIVLGVVGEPSQVEPLRAAIAKIVEVEVRAECSVRVPLRSLWVEAED